MFPPKSTVKNQLKQLALADIGIIGLAKHMLSSMPLQYGAPVCKHPVESSLEHERTHSNPHV